MLFPFQLDFHQMKVQLLRDQMVFFSQKANPFQVLKSYPFSEVICFIWKLSMLIQMNYHLGHLLKLVVSRYTTLEPSACVNRLKLYCAHIYVFYIFS